MPELKLKHTTEIISGIWKSYHRFVFRYLFFHRLAAKIFIGFTCLSLLIGISGTELFLYIGLYLVAFYFFYMLWMAIKINLSQKNVVRVYEKSGFLGKEFTFIYDENGFGYDRQGMKKRLNWEDFDSYFEYEMEIFLLDQQRKPLEIISSKIIENQHFEAIKARVRQQVRKAR